MDRKPSEIIQDFLDLVEKSHSEFTDAKSKVSSYNSKTYDWTHALEDAPNKSERNKIATAWQRELRDRRIEKDRMSLWEKIHEMGAENQNKPFLKRLHHLMEAQRRTEDYIDTPYSQREYKKGALVGNDDNRGQRPAGQKT